MPCARDTARISSRSRSGFGPPAAFFHLSLSLSRSENTQPGQTLTPYTSVNIRVTASRCFRLAPAIRFAMSATGNRSNALQHPPMGVEEAVALPSDTSPLESPLPSRPGSRRPSAADGMSSGVSLSRRNSLASGPRPITKAEYSGPATPSLLSRAGSPTLSLAESTAASPSYCNSERAKNSHHGHGESSALDGRRELQQGEFIGSVDCGTT